MLHPDAGRGATGVRSDGERPGRLLLGIALVAMAALAYQGARERSQRPGARLEPSPEQEVALARELGGLDPDPAIQRTVQQVGGRLSAAAASPRPFDFQVLADPRTVNAFVLPGGSILITRGLYARLENEAELAGVLAHEIGHAVAGDPARESVPASFAASDTGASPRAEQPESFSTRLLRLEFGRSDELAADAASVELMSAAGYDPRALIRVMRLLDASAGDAAQPGFARTHPDSGDRAARIGKAIDRRFPGGVAPELTAGRNLLAADLP